MKAMRDLSTGRRRFLKALAAATAGAGLLSAAQCGETQIVEVVKEVPVEKIKEVVKEVAVEKEVIKVVTVEAKPVKAGLAKIEWWFGWGGMTGINALNAVANAFNKENDDLQVIPVQVSGITEKLLTAIAGGNPPTVETGNIVVSEFWTRGAAQPLTDMLKSSKKINPDIFFPFALKQGQWKGVQYGVPAVEGYLRWALSVNEQIATDAGLNLDTMPQTLDEMVEWSKKMTKIDSVGNVAILGFDPMDSMGGSFGGGDPFLWGPVFGFDYWDEKNLKYNLNNEGMVRTLDHIKELYDIVGAEKIEGFRKSYGTWTESPTSSYPVGVQGANINGYWEPGEMAKSSIDPKTGQPRNFKYGWPYMAPEKKGVKLQGTGGHFGMIPKGAKGLEEGFRFIEHLNGQGAVDIIFNTTGWLPAQPALVKKADISKYRGLDFYTKSQDEATAWGREYVDPIQGFVTNLWWTKTAAVYFGKEKASDAVKEWQDLADAELKERFPQGL